MSQGRWLVFAYTLPPEPSRLRVAVWRRLRRLGAIYLPEGFWILPHTEALAAEVQKTVKEIEGYGGAMSAFSSSDFDSEQSLRIRSKILEARNEEYAELQRQCAKFVLHVEHATTTERYTFSEIEELEEEIAKIERWLEEIHARDHLSSPEYDRSLGAVRDCRGLLQQFLDAAFERSERASTPIAPLMEHPS